MDRSCLMNVYRSDNVRLGRNVSFEKAKVEAQVELEGQQKERDNRNDSRKKIPIYSDAVTQRSNSLSSLRNNQVSQECLERMCIEVPTDFVSALCTLSHASKILSSIAFCRVVCRLVTLISEAQKLGSYLACVFVLDHRLTFYNLKKKEKHVKVPYVGSYFIKSYFLDLSLHIFKTNFLTIQCFYRNHKTRVKKFSQVVNLDQI